MYVWKQASLLCCVCTVFWITADWLQGWEDSRGIDWALYSLDQHTDSGAAHHTGTCVCEWQEVMCQALTKSHKNRKFTCSHSFHGNMWRDCTDITLTSGSTTVQQRKQDSHLTDSCCCGRSLVETVHSVEVDCCRFPHLSLSFFSVNGINLLLLFAIVAWIMYRWKDKWVYILKHCLKRKYVYHCNLEPEFIYGISLRAVSKINGSVSAVPKHCC